jgi:DNA polymerase-3 subunit delta'
MLRDVVGQDAIKQRLLRSVLQNRVPHAQLILGNMGQGSLALALAYAQLLTCKHPGDHDACGECSSCRKNKTHTHPDVHFSFPFPSSSGETASDLLGPWREQLSLTPYFNYEDWMRHLGSENKQGNIPIKECRAIIKGLSLKPFEAERKILILWLPEFLGQEGNVLLKMIEEPPAGTVFLLVAEKTDRILNTILSRTQALRVPPLHVRDVTRALEQNGVEPQAAARAAQLCQGDFRQALHLIDQVQSPYFESWKGLLGNAYTRKMDQVASWADEAGSLGREGLKAYMQYGLALLRAALLHEYVDQRPEWSPQEGEFLDKFMKLNVDIDAMDRMVGQLESAIYEIERNGNAKMILTTLGYGIAKNIRN